MTDHASIFGDEWRVSERDQSWVTDDALHNNEKRQKVSSIELKNKQGFVLISIHIIYLNIDLFVWLPGQCGNQKMTLCVNKSIYMFTVSSIECYCQIHTT